jgi:hypothetical protein
VARQPTDATVLGDMRYSLSSEAFDPIWGIRFTRADAPTEVEWVNRSRQRQISVSDLWAEISGRDARYLKLAEIGTDSLESESGGAGSLMRQPAGLIYLRPAGWRRFDKWTQRLRNIKAIQIHHLVPRCDEIVDELLLRIGTSIDFRHGAQQGVGTENKVNARAGPLDRARFAITSFKQIRFRRDRLPLRAHVEQVHEEVVGQRFGALGEDAMLRAAALVFRRAFRR